jgi:hypothetical protein
LSIYKESRWLSYGVGDGSSVLGQARSQVADRVPPPAASKAAGQASGGRQPETPESGALWARSPAVGSGLHRLPKQFGQGRLDGAEVRYPPDQTGDIQHRLLITPCFQLDHLRSARQPPVAPREGGITRWASFRRDRSRGLRRSAVERGPTVDANERTGDVTDSSEASLA